MDVRGSDNLGSHALRPDATLGLQIIKTTEDEEQMPQAS
jgi:hypothetical protein